MKSIIALLDGTLNSAMRLDSSDGVSNVFKMNNALSYEKDKLGNIQFSTYYSGVGSDGIWKNKPSFLSKIRSKIEAMTSSGLEQQIVEGYVNICTNYVLGDKIYLIGFSRGAVAAKIISDLIGEFGIIKSNSIEQFSTMWEIVQGNIPNAQANNFIKLHFHRGVMIEYLGLFDAVLGWTSRSRSILKNKAKQKLSKCVKRCLHILSIDEDRMPFKNLSIESDFQNVVKNVWLPGFHSDIGGVYKNSTVGDVSLLTMLWDIKYHTSINTRNSEIISIANKVFQNIKSDIRIYKESNLFWTALGKKNRIIAKGSDNFIHPIIDYFYNLNVAINNNISFYTPPLVWLGDDLDYDHTFDKMRSKLERLQKIELVARNFPRPPQIIKPPMGPSESMVFSR